MKSTELKNSAHLQVGKQTEIAVVFSCPGQEEEKQNRPTSGVTGNNLETLLGILYKIDFLKTKYCKCELRITNAWDKVIYKSKDKRTEAKLTKKEIYSEDNINRLKKELDNIDTIICFGYKARKAIDNVYLVNDKTILYAPHLGLQSLNRNSAFKNDINGNLLIKGDKTNTYKRLEIIANNLAESNAK